LNSPR